MALKGSTNEEKIWNYLVGKGLSAAGTAGLMGNLYAESGLRPNNLQNSYEKSLGYSDEAYTAAVDSGSYGNFVRDSAGYGLAQWTYWSRKQNMLNYHKAAGKSIGDLETQLGFLFKELSEGYGSLLSLLKSTTSVKAASDAVLTQFERPADMSDAAKTRRAGYGQPYYDKYAGKTPGGEQKKEEETKMGYSRQKVVDLALSWVGKRESDGSHKSIIDIYNTLPVDKLPRRTRMQYDWAWCACTWSALAVKLGYLAIMPIEISCYYLIENAKKMGCWVEADNYVPSPGDAILYDWSDGSNYDSYDNTAAPDHVGTVVSVNKSAGTFVVVEGNMSNAVGKRTMAVNGRYIRGFIAPRYDDNTVTEPKDSGGTSGGGTTLNRTAKWTGVVTADSLNARMWAGTENAQCSFSPLKQGKEIGVCDTVKASDGAAWYYIKSGDKYGFVHSAYVKKKDETGSTGGTQAALKVGDIVQFNGSKHYTSANAVSGKACKGGKAKITQIYQLGKSKHPYHLIAEKGGGSTVYGWVDAADIGQTVGSSTPVATRTYTVKKGDSLWAIAAKQLGNGSRYKEIKDLNGLKSDTIYAGQVLKLPE